MAVSTPLVIPDVVLQLSRGNRVRPRHCEACRTSGTSGVLVAPWQMQREVKARIVPHMHMYTIRAFILLRSISSAYRPGDQQQHQQQHVRTPRYRSLPPIQGAGRTRRSLSSRVHGLSVR